MRMRWLVMTAAVLSAILPGVASAILDAPHDASFSDAVCDKCHALYTTSATTGQRNYNTGCLSCHDASHNTSFGFPWLDTDQAKPGVSGNSHSWSGAAGAEQYGVPFPTAIVLTNELYDGTIQCSSCHNPHSAVAVDPASKHTSMELGVATDETGNGTTKGNVGGTAKMTLLSVGTVAKGFRLSVLDAGGGARSFIISHDFGLATPTWLNYSGGTWVAGTVAGPGRAITAGATIALDDAAFTVKFSALPAVGDYWDFYVGFPFLRFSNVDNADCVTCHSTWNMDHARARGDDTKYTPDGTRKFSHPVGDALNANGFGRDAATIRDANGDAQTVGDGNTTNDLALRNGVVRCTTCHAVHNADSNSLTKDLR
jgi:hypothetical protein